VTFAASEPQPRVSKTIGVQPQVPFGPIAADFPKAQPHGEVTWYCNPTRARLSLSAKVCVGRSVRSNVWLVPAGSVPQKEQEEPTAVETTVKRATDI
jgi:hypothetical protein